MNQIVKWLLPRTLLNNLDILCNVVNAIVSACSTHAETNRDLNAAPLPSRSLLCCLEPSMLEHAEMTLVAIPKPPLSLAAEKDRDHHCTTLRAQKEIVISILPLETYVKWIAAVNTKMILDTSVISPLGNLCFAADSLS